MRQAAGQPDEYDGGVGLIAAGGSPCSQTLQLGQPQSQTGQRSGFEEAAACKQRSMAFLIHFCSQRDSGGMVEESGFLRVAETSLSSTALSTRAIRRVDR